MKARVAVYDMSGTVRRGVMPVRGLQFQEDLGGAGSCSYDALGSDLDLYKAWDAVIVIELETPTGWVMGPSYVSRHDFTHKGGFREWHCNLKSILTAWAKETVLLPEYVMSVMPPKVLNDQRGLGWMSSAYLPTSDTKELWNRCYEPSGRTARPKGWPSGTGAKWISATGFSETAEAKFFRAWITVPLACRVRFYISSDENVDLYVAGELIIARDASEEDKANRTVASMVMYPGTYAVGAYTIGISTKGGDGVDPIIVAAERLDINGKHVSWLLASNENTWVACRRDVEQPNNVPPGPNPGQVLILLIQEAKERYASGWNNIVYNFTDLSDAYGNPWTTVIEELHPYTTTYDTIFKKMVERDDCDLWMSDGITLNAANRQGEARSLVLTDTHLNTFTTAGKEGFGTWAFGQSVKGWTYQNKAGPRREYTLSLGNAFSDAIAKKVLKASLRDSWLWTGTGVLNPPQPGWIPYVDIRVGDNMHIDYRAIERQLSITSFTARAIEGGLEWTVQFTEYPPEAAIPHLDSEPPPGKTEGEKE